MKNKFKNINFFVKGYYGYNNIGDEVLLRAILENLKRYLPTSRIKFVYKNKEQAKKLNIPVVDNYKNDIRNSDVILFGGGTQFSDIDGAQAINLFHNLKLIVYAKILGKKIICLGVGIGPIKNVLSKIIIYLSLMLTDLILVRDHISFLLLTKMRFFTKTYITYDLALSLSYIKSNSKQKKAKIKKIGINLINLDENCFFNEIIDNLNNLMVDNNLDYYLFSAEESQENYLYFIKEKLNKNIEIKNYQENIENYLEMIKDFDIIISTKLHPLIFSLAFSIPCIAISYHEKVSSFMKDAGLSNFVIEPKEIVNNKTVVKDKFVELVCNYKEIRQNIISNFAETKQKSLLNFILLKEKLENE